MDNLRVFLWVGLALLLWMSYDAWQRQFPPSAPPAEVQAGPDAPATPAADALPALPETGAAPAPTADMSGMPDLPGDQRKPDTRQLISVRTDVLELTIDLHGGEVVAAKLLAYPLKKDRPDVPVQLLSSDAADYFVVT